MATKYAIETVYKIIDQVSGPLAGMGKSSKKFASNLKRDFNSAAASVSKLGKSIDRVVKTSLVAGGAAVVAGLAVATRQMVDFNASMTKAGALFKDLDPTSASFGQSLKVIGQAARDVAAKTEFSAVDTADALQKMAMAGVDSATAMELLAGTADLATAAGVSLGDAVGMAMDSMGALGMKVGAENLQKISDVMAKAGSLANTDLPGVFDAMKTAGPIFTSAGQSVETLAAAIDMLAAGGIKGAEAGTQLKAIFMQLGQSAKRAQLKKLGISVVDSQGNFLSLVDIVGQLDKKLSKMGAAKRSGIINSIFGARGAVAINNMLNQGVDALKGYEEALKNADGAANAMAETMRGSLANRIEVVKSALIELGLKFVENLGDKSGDLLKKIADKILELSQNCGPLVDKFNQFVEVAVKVIGWLWSMRDIIADLIIVWGLFKAAVMITNFVNVLMPFLHILGALLFAEGKLTIAQNLLNAAMAANPVGLIVAAVVALIGLTILLVKHWDAVKNAIKSAGAWILDKVLAPVQAFLNLASKIPGIGGKFAEGAANFQAFRDSLKGEGEGEAPAPVTTGDRVTYSEDKTTSDVHITVAPEKGATANIVGAAPDVDIKMLPSGAF